MQTPEAHLMDSLLGTLRTQALRAALDLGIPELLAARPRTADDLAAACSCDPVALRRLLDALAADGVLAASPAGEFALTAVGERLRPSAAGGIGEYAEFMCAVTTATSAHLTESIRTGRGGAAFEAATGRPFFRHLAEDPAAGEQFDTAMHVSLGGLRDGLLALDWSGARTVADVGGGTGGLLAALLAAHPHLHGTLCEQPHVLPAARAVLDGMGLAERCTLAPCDFFAEVPAGRDAYLLVRVLHDWDDAAAIRLLGAVRAAMHPGARLYVADLLLPDSDDEEGARWRRTYDLFINLVIPGHERTARAWHALLASAGFRVARTAPAGWRGSLLECVPLPREGAAAPADGAAAAPAG